MNSLKHGDGSWVRYRPGRHSHSGQGQKCLLGIAYFTDPKLRFGDEADIMIHSHLSLLAQDIGQASVGAFP